MAKEEDRKVTRGTGGKSRMRGNGERRERGRERVTGLAMSVEEGKGKDVL